MDGERRQHRQPPAGGEGGTRCSVVFCGAPRGSWDRHRRDPGTGRRWRWLTLAKGNGFYGLEANASPGHHAGHNATWRMSPLWWQYRLHGALGRCRMRRACMTPVTAVVGPSTMPGPGTFVTQADPLQARVIVAMGLRDWWGWRPP